MRVQPLPERHVRLKLKARRPMAGTSSQTTASRAGDLSRTPAVLVPSAVDDTYGWSFWARCG